MPSTSWGKVECLNKDCVEKGSKEAIYKAKENEDTGKGKAEEPQKKIKLSHSSSSTSMKFGTTVVHVCKTNYSSFRG